MTSSFLVLAQAFLAQGGSGLSQQISFMPDPLYKVLLAIAGLLFLAAIAKGGMDMARPKDPDAPPATPATWLSRIAPMFLSLLNLVAIGAVLAGTDPRQFHGLQLLAELLLVLQLAVVILAFRNPEGKKVMRIIHTALLIAGVIALPLFLLGPAG